MKKRILLIVLFLTSSTPAQSPGTMGISVQGSYSMPMAGLSDWFKPAPGYNISFGVQKDADWFMGGMIEYVLFEEENLSGYPAGKLELELQHIGILFNARYQFTSAAAFRPYLDLSVGPYYWKGTRGEIQPDPELSIPYIAGRTLEEWNFGFKAGFGLAWHVSRSFAVDISVIYRLVIGDLWPTLQQYIELEGVSGFQTINPSLGLRYYF